MKSLFISLLFFLATINSCISQGLNVELSFNNTIAQYAHSIVNVGEYSYFTMNQVQPGNNGSKYLLIKTDTLGNIVWEVELQFPLSNLNDPISLIPTSDSGILVYGDAFFCDVAINCIDYIQKFDKEGNLLWSKEWLDVNCFRISISGLAADTSFIYANYMQGDTSAILQYDLAGNLLDSLPIDQSNLIQVQSFGIYEKTGIKTNQLFGFDTLGNSTFARYFSSPIQGFETLNDTLYLLTSDSIFSFDTSLQLLDANYNVFFAEFSNLKVYDNEIRFLSSAGGQENVLILDHELQFNNIVVISENIPTSTPKDFNDSHFTAAINFVLYDFFSIRHLDFSLSSNQNTIVNRTDIGIIDIQETQVSCNPYHVPNVYNFQIFANVLIKNYGNQILNDCKINHYITTGICELVTYFEHFTNLNLAPGDSVWLNCGLIHSELEFLSGPDTLRENICVYTSHPNSITDLNVSNDAYCESIAVGYVGINELEENELQIFPNPANTFIHIENERLENYHYSIYTIHGKLIKEGNFINQEIAINELSSGMYILKLNSLNGGKSLNKNFIKE